MGEGGCDNFPCIGKPSTHFSLRRFTAGEKRVKGKTVERSLKAFPPPEAVCSQQFPTPHKVQTQERNSCYHLPISRIGLWIPRGMTLPHSIASV